MRSFLPRAIVSFVVTHVAKSQSNVAFDAAIASSTYPGATFTAEQAISAGSNYWCSSGSHVPGQIVTWTGTANARHKVLGVTINWAYGPGEYKILTSADGGNFEEAACWRAPTRTEVSYEESVMFDTARNAKSVIIAMRSPMAWSYFGINSVALIVEPYPFVLVSPASSTTGEMCVVARGGGLATAPCLDALARGDGRELFQFEGDHIMHIASEECVTLENGDSVDGGKLGLATCADASDGRSSFEITTDGQLKMKHMGGLCAQVTTARAWVQDCSEGGDKYSMVAVPEFDPSAAAIAASAAALLNSAARRQRSLLAKLQAALPTLETCKLPASLARNFSRTKQPMSLLAASRVAGAEVASDPALVAISQVYPMHDVDVAGLKTLIADSVGVLSKIASAA